SLGYPFLFFALYLIKHATGAGAGADDSNGDGGTRKALALFLWHTCGYVVLLSVVYGWAVGWAAKGVLRWAEKRQYVDRESFLVFAVSLALFVVGTCGMAGSDDVLACFVAGNAFTWDDWFRLKTIDDSVQPTVDMLLNVAMFMWLGATCPWSSFWTSDVVTPGRLAALGVLVLLFRRLPVILGLHRRIHQIEDDRQALFVGHFGPIGVSAIFYLYVGLEFLQTVTVGDEQRPDVKQLGEVMTVVIWFLIICSVVVHGLSVPAAKLGFRLWTAAYPRPIALPS
ncbi:Na(+)/H(+) antiporter, partial [Magnaporthiopsis poae ATCC 64411]|uniref:Na(+)/H(+) antiporter n=1 Tax=Magnaporthiopsis poae (strain ATCC 64411 / 73-15) TaxID=644358 RepID=A0A0C4E7U0_MAGP6